MVTKKFSLWAGLAAALGTSACIGPNPYIEIPCTRQVLPSSSECLESALADVTLAPYARILADNENVRDAIGLCELPVTLQNRIWDHIRLAEIEDAPPNVDSPSGFHDAGDVIFPLPQDTAYDIHAAHIAHSLWLEKNEITPWRLFDMRAEHLCSLYQVDGFFSIWNDDTQQYTARHLLNHSPAEAFTIAQSIVNLNTGDQDQAVVDIIRSVRPFIHGRQIIDNQLITTISQMHDEEISRHGCHSMSKYVAFLSRSINIPSTVIYGWFDEGGHRSAAWPTVDRLLGHGDHVYARGLANTPSDEILEQYRYWEENVFSHPHEDPLAVHNSHVHEYRMMMAYPSYYTQEKYCANGRPYLDETFSEYAANEELTEFENRLLEITDRCRTLVPDTAE